MTLLQLLLKGQAYVYRDEVKAAWSEGNEAGEGFAVGRGHHTEYVDGLYEGWEILNYGRADGALMVCANIDRIMAIGDNYGPWAVDITARLMEKMPCIG